MKISQDRRKILQGAAIAASASSMFGFSLEALAAAAKGGVVVIGTTQKPRHLNSAVQSGIATMSPAAQLFATPLLMNANWEPQPYLAEKWEISEDGRSLRLALNKSAIFHDGKPITTEDLLFSIETVQNNHPFKSILAPVNGVTIEDAHNAVIRLSEPHPALLLAMSTSFMPIIPKHIFGDGKELKTHPRNSNPVGSGPFKLVDFKPGEHIIMERFDKFFMPGLPHLDRVIYKRYKDPSSLLLALEKGEIDIHIQLTSPPDIKRAGRMKNITVVKSAAPAVGPLVWIAFNTANEKLSDKRVRQALNYAIDKEFITETLLAGVHKRATGPIVSASPFYTPDVETYKHNLEKANKLLDEAGVKPDADGVRMTLEVDSIPGNPEMKIVQEYMVPAFKKIGIAAKVRQSPDFPTWARRISSHDFEVTVDSVWNWGDPVIGVHRSWTSSNIRKGVIWSNTQSYKNARVDTILETAGTETDLDKRKAAYAEVQKIVTDDCPVAFVYELTFHYGINKRITGEPDNIWGLISPVMDMSIKS